MVNARRPSSLPAATRGTHAFSFKIGPDPAASWAIPRNWEHLLTLIRPATADDAGAVSLVILRALRETNAGDYPQSVIARVESSFSATAVRRLIAGREVFVAVVQGRIVGTASLDGSTVRAVFVVPDLQGRGIGRLLMARVVESGRDKGLAALLVPSSVTAEPFYAKLGFKVLRENLDGEERTVVMELGLGTGRGS